MIPYFKAYLIKHEKIVDVREINYNLLEIGWRDDDFHDTVSSFDDIKFIQPTGLLDKKGKEIFEGHIVKDTDGYVGYIAFLKQEMGYVVVYKTYDKRLGHRYRLDDGRLEILGNIYQDKHLLEED